MSNLLRRLWKISFFRLCVYYLGLFFVLPLMRFRMAQTCYIGARVFCYLFRLIYNDNYSNSNTNFFEQNCLYHYQRIFKKISAESLKETNLIYEGFKKSRKAQAYRKYFKSVGLDHCVRLKYPRYNDTKERQGDLMILKPYKGKDEKGVMIVHYTESLAKFAALYDLKKIANRYRIIFEPSWWGYQNVYFLFFYGLPTEIIIECPYEADYNFIKKMNCNFYPTRLGAGDWVDPANFSDGKDAKKKYDIVMVGNWSKIKRHEILFKALSKIESGKSLSIALIGYPSKGRTIENIIFEAKKYNIENNIHFFEKISPEEVAKVLREAKINILLSQGEGANRGIYEGLFCGNVLIVNINNRGVNMENINTHTGYKSSDDDLPYVILEALDSYEMFETGKWARGEIGFLNSTLKLNEFVKSVALKSNEKWSENLVHKKNLPNNVYAYRQDLLRIDTEYAKMKEFIN